MKLRAFLLADHAEAVNGKLYLMGGSFDRIFAPKFPVVHSHMSVAGVLAVDWQETNDMHTFELTLEDADGTEVTAARIQGQFELGRPPGLRPGDESNVPLVFNENNLTFERPGQYAYVLKIDGAEIERLRFKLVPMQPVVATA